MDVRGWAFALLIAQGLPLSAQSLTYEGLLSSSGGAFIFDQPTTTFGLTTGLAFATGHATLRVSLPVLTQNTVLVSATGAGALPTGGPYGGMVADSGRHMGGGNGGSGGSGGGGPALAAPAEALRGFQVAVGDPVAQLTLTAPAGARTTLSFGASVKAPLADTASYGTGNWDVGASVGLSTLLGGATTLGIDAGYWHLGDMPTFDFQNPVTATVSVGRLFSRWGASLFVMGATTAMPGYTGPVSVGVSANRLGRGSTWGISAGAGLTETAPSLFLNLSWRVPLVTGS